VCGFRVKSDPLELDFVQAAERFQLCERQLEGIDRRARHSLITDGCALLCCALAAFGVHVDFNRRPLAGRHLARIGSDPPICDTLRRVELVADHRQAVGGRQGLAHPNGEGEPDRSGGRGHRIASFPGSGDRSAVPLPGADLGCAHACNVAPTLAELRSAVIVAGE
jgi:hypothetical protein